MKKLICVILGLAAVCFAQTFAERDPHYRLQPEDKIEVQYRYTPEYNAAVSVQPDGFVSLPYIGEVKVTGLTIAEASEAIRKKACERLNDPDVVLLLKDYVKPYFIIAGEVNRPGRFDLRGDVGLIEAVALGGGFKDSAHRKQVVLLRKASSELAQVTVVDVNKLMSDRGILEDIQIRPGDMVVVPRNFISKMQPFMRLTDLGLYGLVTRIP
jgi:polysaccharide export outer membrane protein